LRKRVAMQAEHAVLVIDADDLELIGPRHSLLFRCEDWRDGATSLKTREILIKCEALGARTAVNSHRM
jgi:hypothetical protein